MGNVNCNVKIVMNLYELEIFGVTCKILVALALSFSL